MRCFLVLALLVFTATATFADPRTKPRLDLHGAPLPEGAVARLGASGFQPPGDGRVAALSPDGKMVAAATYTNGEGTSIHFMDASSGKIVRTPID